MRSMVEGQGPYSCVFGLGKSRPCPSTTLQVVPLPVPGRNQEGYNDRYLA